MDQIWTPPATHELTMADGRLLRYCEYGAPNGLPAFSLAGTPGTRWERPDVVDAIEDSGLRVVVPDRPGYGGSARQRGRAVADIAADVRLIADAHGWDRFAVTGFSGGGPHALACAALLGGCVTRCAIVSCPAPSDAAGVDFFRRETPGDASDFRLALLGEQALRPYLAKRASGTLASVGSEHPADPGRITRIRAMYQGLDGWIDDVIALVHPWGFDLGSIAVPVSLWSGADDTRVPHAHSDWLLAHTPAAQGFEFAGGHDPDDVGYRRVLAWMAGAWT